MELLVDRKPLRHFNVAEYRANIFIVEVRGIYSDCLVRIPIETKFRIDDELGGETLCSKDEPHPKK